MKLKLIVQREAHPRRQRRRLELGARRPERPVRRVPVRRVAVAVGGVEDLKGPAGGEAVLGDGGPDLDGVVGLRGQRDGGGPLLGLRGVVGGDDEAQVAGGRVDGDTARVDAVPLGDEFARGGVAVERQRVNMSVEAADMEGLENVGFHLREGSVDVAPCSNEAFECLCDSNHFFFFGEDGFEYFLLGSRACLADWRSAQGRKMCSFTPVSIMPSCFQASAASVLRIARQRSKSVTLALRKDD